MVYRSRSLSFTQEESMVLLKKYYKSINLSDITISGDGGDGSTFLNYDIIDLENNTLIKVRDYYEDDPATDLGSENMLDDEYYTMSEDGYRTTKHEEALDRIWCENPTAVSVDYLIDMALTFDG